MDPLPIEWHRLFGIALVDFFRDSPFDVELEKDLSLKKQQLDVVILRKKPGEFPRKLPDGLDSLVDHNLISFKSHQDALTPWSIKELLSYYVNYRKQVSPASYQLLTEDKFKLFAVCARFPHQLHGKLPLEEQASGVHLCRLGIEEVTVIVLRDLPEEEHNAMLHLFSAVPKKIEYAKDFYQQCSQETSTLIQQLLLHYKKEGIDMPYTMEDFRRDAREYTIREMLKEYSLDELLAKFSKEEILKKFPPEERLQGISPDKRLEGISPDKRLEGISPDKRLEGISPDELLAGLSPEQIQTLLDKLKAQEKKSDDS